MKIQFATKEDSAVFAAVLLHDKDASFRLDSVGNDFDLKKGYWEASFVAVDDDKNLLGLVSVEMRCSLGTIRINKLYVMQEYRKQGVASELLQFAEEFGQTNWYARAFDAITIENKIMHQLLKKHNYKKMGTYKNFVYRGGKFYNQTYWQKQI